MEAAKSANMEGRSIIVDHVESVKSTNMGGIRDIVDHVEAVKSANMEGGRGNVDHVGAVQSANMVDRGITVMIVSERVYAESTTRERKFVEIAGAVRFAPTNV